MRFVRLKHDWQWMGILARMLDRLWNKGFWASWYPAVVRLFKKSNLSGDAAYMLTKERVAFERQLNPKYYRELERPAAGRVNKRSKSKAIPADLKNYQGNTVGEPIGCAGNVYDMIEQTARAVKLRMVGYLATSPDPKEVNYEKTPWLITLMTSISRWGTQGWATGKPLYYSNLAKQDGLWVAKERVEFFPSLPMNLRVVTDALRVRALPSTKASVMAVLEMDEEVRIIEYLPQGSNVWAKMDTGGWICVAYTIPGAQGRSATQYYTSWKMETAPPLAPR